MKCEKCASEMPGGRVICPACGASATQQRVDQWKAQRQATKSESPAEKPVSPVAAKIRARYATETNLLHFPVPHKAESEDKAPPAEPVWREQTKARVREHLQRRKAEDDGTPETPVIPTTPSEEITTQLIVESALKRIRRTAAPPPAAPVITPRQALRGGNQALARAFEPEEQLAPEPAPATAPSLAEPAANPVPLPELPAAPAFRAYANSSPNPVVKLPNRPVETAELAADRHVAEEAAPPCLAEQPRTTTHKLQNQADTPATPEDPAAAARQANLWLGKPAPLWLRALAGAVDLEAAALAYLPFFGMYSSLDGPPGWADLYVLGGSLAIVVYLYLLITYSFNGRTFGMMLCGLRCVDLADPGTPVNLQRRLWQALGGTVALLCPPFNYLVTRVSTHQRGLADVLAQTITLRRSPE
jgi:uncharacterized RDD family membrane protein YckC